MPSPTPTLAPTPTPVPTPTQIPSASGAVTSAAGGTVAVTGGPTLTVPAGGVPADTTGTIRASAGPPPAESDAWPAVPIGPTWEVGLGGDNLSQPATLVFHVDPATLPTGVTSGGLFVGYFDPTSSTWQPVQATIDPATGTAIATISHLSRWGLFGFDIARWLVTLKALASGQITDLTTAVQKLLTDCSTTGGSFKIDNSAANNMVQGCFTGTPTGGTAALTVTNLRAFALSFSSPRGYVAQQLVAPGDSVSLSVPNTDPPPATVSATMTSEGLWWSVTDIVMRMLPNWTTLKASPDYKAVVAAAAAGTKAAWDASTIGGDIAARKYAQAAEATVALLTGKGYLDALVAALQLAATRYHLPWLAVVDQGALQQILKVVNLADLIVTTWSFFGDYFFNAQTTVSVSWTGPAPKPTPTAAPKPAPTPLGTPGLDLRSLIVSTIRNNQPGVGVIQTLGAWRDGFRSGGWLIACASYDDLTAGRSRTTAYLLGIDDAGSFDSSYPGGMVGSFDLATYDQCRVWAETTRLGTPLQLP